MVYGSALALHVKWIHTQPNEEICLFSSALDGRVTQWHLHNNSLVHINILDFKNYEMLAKPLPPPEKIILEGLVTCIAFCPADEHMILVGVDTGVIYQCSTVCSVHTLLRYSAHTSPVRIAWNGYHSHKIFYLVQWIGLLPLITLDLGAAVAAVTWSPYSSSVFVAVTDDGRVKWIHTQPNEEICLFSSALDGRVTQWHLHNNSLVHINILDFKNYEMLAKPLPPPEKIILEGLVTCIAFCPADEHMILVGVDTGVIYQCSTVCSVHTLLRYSAHTSPVRGIAWNGYHSKIFLSCSVDWTVKVWLQHKMLPLITLDLGAAVAAVTWSPYSSSVFVAVTDDGRVHIYDLFVRRLANFCIVSRRYRLERPPNGHTRQTSSLVLKRSLKSFLLSKNDYVASNLGVSRELDINKK
ncbi:dynein axonemal intermediate chain 1-like [Penaeus japonicus]|uniref:dynein axonemal intermediate chain 1-like n=1 Tax=Penaeus japonicus TaxID=27405 RepID=UPI001C70E5FF|nr:dynein axonemal intermediate chain 1-like [Penaeus japonicus]